MRSLSAFLTMFLLLGCPPPAEKTTGGQARGQVQAGGAPALVGPAPDTVVATWTGGQMTWGELEQEARGRLIRMEVSYLNERDEALRSAINNTINKALLDAEAKQRGVASADALREQVQKENATVTDAEARAFYDANQKRYRNKPFEEVQKAVTDALVRTRQKEAWAALVEQLRARSDVQISLAPPELPRIEVPVDDDPVRGEASAPVTIIEFADYECPYCARGYQTMKQVMETYPGKTRWVYRDFPLSFHRNAMNAAVASNCAGAQGKYWEMHDLIFDNQKAMTEADLETYAGQIGLDAAAWKTCYTEREAQLKEIAADQTSGSEAGVTGTPAYFLNGLFISGARPFEDFKAAIDTELERLGK
ncbi:MAG: thioredoxin domain-containing protein [Deltaproteobacteria bacterium]|nr:thioredoxin domain-containing protein [Deltaproteobacteria bacterium]